MKKTVLCIFLLCFGFFTYSQTSKSENKEGVPSSNAFAPADNFKKSNYAKVKSKSKKRLTHAYYRASLDNKIVEFEKRMEANKKKYRKEQKLKQKPQYSDASYFGHKRPPKKRSVSKRKFCKECGIVH